MTDEHVPPKSTGNDDHVQLIEDPFDLPLVLRQVAEWDEGHVVRSLDRRCNGRASEWGYVKEYRRWHQLFVDARTAGRATHVNPFRGDQPFRFGLPYDVMPARFVRQAVGMLLAVQESAELFANAPQVVDLIGSDPNDDERPRGAGLSVNPMHLYMSVYSGRWAYSSVPFTSVTLDLTPSALVVPPGARARNVDVFLLALAPFAFVASCAPQENVGFNISEWASWEYSQRPDKRERSLEVPTVDMMQSPLRAMLFPADYIIH